MKQQKERNLKHKRGVIKRDSLQVVQESIDQILVCPGFTWRGREKKKLPYHAKEKCTCVETKNCFCVGWQKKMQVYKENAKKRTGSTITLGTSIVHNGVGFWKTKWGAEVIIKLLELYSQTGPVMGEKKRHS